MSGGGSSNSIEQLFRIATAAAAAAQRTGGRGAREERGERKQQQRQRRGNGHEMELTTAEFMEMLNGLASSRGGARCPLHEHGHESGSDEEMPDLPCEAVEVGDVFIVKTGGDGDGESAVRRLGEVVGLEGFNKGIAQVRLIGDYGCVSKTTALNLQNNHSQNLGCQPKLRPVAWDEAKTRKVRAAERQYRQDHPKRNSMGRVDWNEAKIEEHDLAIFSKIVTNFALEHIESGDVRTGQSVGTQLLPGSYGSYRPDFWNRVKANANAVIEPLNVGWRVAHLGLMYDSKKAIRIDFQETEVTGDPQDDIPMSSVKNC